MVERNPTLLRMAQDKPCQLQIAGVCNGRTDTTVAAHSNWLVDGKGMGHKASDASVVWACAACHAWLDQGQAFYAEKRRAYLQGMERMRVQYRRIAEDILSKPAHVQAAKWALERMK